MSRIGRRTIAIPSGVNVNVNNNVVTVTGPLGTLTQTINPNIGVAVENNQVVVSNTTNAYEMRAQHGLYRQLISNMVEGVSKGFAKKLNINGVGYKITQKGEDLVLNIGLSHPVEIKAEPGIKLSCEKTEITVSGINKEQVGRFAAYIRDIKPCEPYHAYGISYVDEVIVRKEAKSAKK